MTTPSNDLNGWKQSETAPKNGDCFLSACEYAGGLWIYTQTKFGEYHPNSKGKVCFRDMNGNRVAFDYWMPLPKPPHESRELEKSNG